MAEPQDDAKAAIVESPVKLDPNRSMKALEYFKDWSNYLLGATVVAIGWLAKLADASINRNLRLASILFFGFSLICAMFTLALIPLIAEQLKPPTDSFYDVKAEFYLCSIKMRWKLKWVCFPQHVLFILGIIAYLIGAWKYKQPLLPGQ